MALRNTQIEYGSVAKWLHWLVALGILALIVLGLLQSDMESGPQRAGIRELHGSIALLVLAMMIVRIAWRWTNETPAHPVGIPGWQRASAMLVHGAIYIAVFVQLISGALAVATGGKLIPALLNAWSRRPNRSRIVSKMARTSDSRAMSACRKVFSLSAVSIWARPACPLSALRPVITTCAPSAANFCAQASPMPEVPPVTIAIFCAMGHFPSVNGSVLRQRAATSSSRSNLPSIE